MFFRRSEFSLLGRIIHIARDVGIPHHPDHRVPLRYFFTNFHLGTLFRSQGVAPLLFQEAEGVAGITGGGPRPPFHSVLACGGAEPTTPSAKEAGVNDDLFPLLTREREPLHQQFWLVKRL